MPRPSRTITPDIEGIDHDGWFIFEVMTKTIAGIFYLAPIEPTRPLRMLGVLGWFLKKHTGVRLLHFSFQSNHVHYLIAVKHPIDLSDFMRDVSSNLTKELNVLNERKGPMWSDRYSASLISAEAYEARSWYLTAQGVLEGVLRDPMKALGATALPALRDGETLHGEWIDRTAYNAAISRWAAHDKEGDRPTEARYAKKVTVPIHVAPCEEHLSEQQRRTNMRHMLKAIIAIGDAHREAKHVPLLDPKKLIKIPTTHVPGKSKTSPRPYCHGTPAQQKATFSVVKMLVKARRAACVQLLAGVSYAKSGFAELEGKIVLPNELQALRNAELRSAEDATKDA